MHPQSPPQRNTALSWLTSLSLAVLVLSALLVSMSPTPNQALAAAPELTSLPPESADFVIAAPQGFGDPTNEWAWGMAWWDGYLYVGTSRQFSCVDQLSRSRVSFGLVPYPSTDPDVMCPEDPLQIDMRAEIWRWHATSDTWERVFQSPWATVTSYRYLSGTLENPILETIQITPTLVARDLGYRGITVFQEADGTAALYVTSISPQFAGYDLGPTRILRSTDGVNFTALPMDPGTMLGDYTRASIRNPFSHVGSDGVRRLYVQGGSSRGAGELLEATHPEDGNDAFRVVTPQGILISSASSFNGQVYVGTNDNANGFGLYRFSPDGGPGPYPLTTLVVNGGYLPAESKPNNELLGMLAFGDHLYFGGNGNRLSVFGQDNLPAELFRIDAADHWDVLVGIPRASTPDGPKVPLSGFGPGFGNVLNGHMWRLSEYQGQLYVSTFDSSYASKDSNPSPALISEMGFDLWRTADGIDFTSITTDSFSANIVDPSFPRPDLHPGAFDVGGRTQAATGYGLFIGTVNPFTGLHIWQSQIPPESLILSAPGVVASHTPTALTAFIGPVTATLPLTYTWEATGAGGPLVRTALLSDTIELDWDAPGTQYITVTATNQAGASLTGSAVLTVLASVPGVGPSEATLSGPTAGFFYDVHRFEASVLPLTATQPLTYVWQVTDQPPITQSGGLRNQVDLSWAGAGEKTVSVEVSNASGLVSAAQSFSVTACSPIQGVQLITRPAGELDDSGAIVVEALAAGGQAPFVYEWRLNGGPPQTLGDRFLLTGTGPGLHEIEVQVTNLCSDVSARLTVLVKASSTDQVELSTSTVLVRPMMTEPGETLTYTIFLRNTSEQPLTTTVIQPIPNDTSLVPGSASASLADPPVFYNGRLVWSGPVRAGITTVLTFSVQVDAGVDPGSRILGQTLLGSSKGRYNLELNSEAVVAPSYQLSIDDGALTAAVPTVTLRYSWDMSTDISEVRFSNKPGFGTIGGANTSDWLPVDPGNPVYADWALDTSGLPSLPSRVYAIFRNDDGRQIGPLATAQILLDDESPTLDNLSLAIAGANAPETQAISVLVRAVASDGGSGVGKLELSNQASFSSYTSFPFTGNSTQVEWNLVNATVYGRVRDRAGNLSAVSAATFVPPADLVVNGPGTASLGAVVNFTASVSPISTTLPITFTWTTTAQPAVRHVVNAITDTVSYSWLVPGVKTISVTASNYEGSVTSSTQVVIQVPDITLSPSSLELFATVGEVVTSSLTIGNVGAGTLIWSLTELPQRTWLSTNPTSGSLATNASQDAIVRFDTTTLLPTTYQGALRLTSNDPDSGVIDIPYTLHVLPVGPQLNVTPDPVLASLVAGTMGSANVTLQNVGDQTLGWSVTVDPPVSWLSASPGNGILQVNASTMVALTLDARALTPDTYQTNLRFESNDADEPTRLVPVQLTVLVPEPMIHLEPAVLSEGLLAQDSRVVALTVGNLGGSALDWSVSAQPPVSWLSVTPASGAVAPGDETLLDVTFAAIVAEGVHTTTLVFTSNDPISPGVVVPVTMEVLTTVPEVAVDPTTLTRSLAVGQSTTDDLTIANNGAATLNWSLTPTPAVSWLALQATGGSLAPGEETVVQITLDAGLLSAGSHFTILRLQSNDPYQPIVDVNVTLDVYEVEGNVLYLPFSTR